MSRDVVIGVCTLAFVLGLWLGATIAVITVNDPAIGVELQSVIAPVPTSWRAV